MMIFHASLCEPIYLPFFGFKMQFLPHATLEVPFMVTDIYRAQQCGYYALFSPAFNNIFIL
jgi:hypothetical protein